MQFESHCPRAVNKKSSNKNITNESSVGKWNYETNSKCGRKRGREKNKEEIRQIEYK